MKVEKDDEIIGKMVTIRSCEAKEHTDNPGCICHLIGIEVKVTKKYKTFLVGTPSYHIKFYKQRVRRSEVSLSREKKVEKKSVVKKEKVEKKPTVKKEKVKKKPTSEKKSKKKRLSIDDILSRKSKDENA